ESNALDCFLQHANGNKENTDLALLLFQYGAYSEQRNQAGCNILHLLYMTYPDLADYVRSQGIKTKDLYEPQKVLTQPHIATHLRLEVKYRDALLQARSAFLNVCILLATSSYPNILACLPKDVFIYMAEFLGLAKSTTEIAACKQFIDNQRDTLKQMAKSP